MISSVRYNSAKMRPCVTHLFNISKLVVSSPVIKLKKLYPFRLYSLLKCKDFIFTMSQQEVIENF